MDGPKTRPLFVVLMFSPGFKAVTVISSPRGFVGNSKKNNKTKFINFFLMAKGQSDVIN